jgi:hypothetical protein
LRFVRRILLQSSYEFANADGTVALAEDVTLFHVPQPTTGTNTLPVGEASILGISPLSVDEAGVTHYVLSAAVPYTASDLAVTEAVVTGAWSYQRLLPAMFSVLPFLTFRQGRSRLTLRERFFLGLTPRLDQERLALRTHASVCTLKMGHPFA